MYFVEYGTDKCVGRTQHIAPSLKFVLPGQFSQHSVIFSELTQHRHLDLESSSHPC